MGNKQDLKEGIKSLRKAILFLVIVFVLVFISILLKVYYLVKDSKYNGKNRFTISVESTKNTAYVLSFSPQDNTASEIIIQGERGKRSPGRIIGIAIDGQIKIDNDNILQNETIDGVLYYTLSHPLTKKTGLTYFDILRLFIFSKTLPIYKYTEEKVNTADDELMLDKIAQRLTVDQRILEERKSIEIINGTGIEGLGKRLERVLKNSGANIIVVTSDQRVQKYSKIINYGDDSYTFNKFKQLLGYVGEQRNERALADIKIIIGEDGLRDEAF